MPTWCSMRDVDLNALDASEVVPFADLPEVVFPPLPNDPPSLVQEDDDEEEEDDNINPNPELNADRAVRSRMQSVSYCVHFLYLVVNLFLSSV